VSQLLDTICRNLYELSHREDGAVTIRELPLQVDPYRPPGLWAFTQPKVGRPRLWCFPQPLHPLEVWASLEGFGGFSTHDREEQKVLALANERARSWVDYTEHISAWLGLTQSETRLVWTLLTPLNLGDDGRPDHGFEGPSDALWLACGATGDNPWWMAATAYVREHRKGLARREKFWISECDPLTTL
jgi:hypothetical protein